MRIAMISESPSMPTGFGQQTRILAEGFVKSGHSVILLVASVPMEALDLPGVTEWRYSNLSDCDNIDEQLNTLTPDIVLVFGCTAFVAHYLKLRTTPQNCPVFYWLPYEGSAVPHVYEYDFRGMPDNMAVHLSKFAKRLWGSHFITENVIPHGYDPDVWEYKPEFSPDDREALRREYSEKFKFPLWADDFIVANVDRNIWHKRWDATFDYIRRLQKEMPDRRVVLLAHTKKKQEEGGGHPPGFDLGYMEKRYGLQGRVCYSGFDWTGGLDRTEICDMIRLCDIRISTSEGEGFGIPTVETAAIGKLQIVNNHTTMPELLGPGNPMLVSPAMTEEKMLSLWAVPNVAAMVTQTMEFVNEPHLATHAIESARLRVEERYTIDTVVGQFLRLFELAQELNAPDDLYQEFRWGLEHGTEIVRVFSDLSKACLELDKGDRVLNVGAFDGRFIDIASEFGCRVVGIESDEKALGRCSQRAKAVIRPQAWTDDWPVADTVVITDMHDQWYEQGGQELVQEMFARASKYEWLVLRVLPRYKWRNYISSPVMSPDMIYQILRANFMERREDLESELKVKHKYFDHQVWRKGGESVEQIPI